jgi:hypothetical protein
VKSDGEADRTWGQFTVLLGLVVLAAATTYVVSGGSLQNVLLVALGAVLLPVWLVWSSSRCTARVLPASPDFGPRERVR